MGKSICFFNNKGGVGKTTLTCNISAFIAKNHNKKILIIDADPQCNSSQYMLSADIYQDILENSTYNTLLDVISPIEEGNSEINYDIKCVSCEDNRFGVYILPGHPRISLFEDKLSRAWLDLNNDVGALRISNWCNNLNNKLKSQYDFIIYDVGPSLGALNRTILLGCDYFVTPMGCDTFSIMGIKNISEWLNEWCCIYKTNLEFLKTRKQFLINKYKEEIIMNVSEKCRYIGYTVQQYIVTRKSKGVKRPTKAYENILTEIPKSIYDNLNGFIPLNLSLKDVNLGDVPHLYSLVPLAQKSNCPIFLLEYKDGLVGSQYTQLDDYQKMLKTITTRLIDNIFGGDNCE